MIPEELFAKIAEKSPLIHCITNYVTINQCANILLACGASPIMADCALETADITAHSDGLVLNLGMLSPEKLDAMLLSAEAAKRKHIPVVLDPVGAGVSEFRRNAAKQLLDAGVITAIRGNFSEISAVCGIMSGEKGVDSGDAISEDISRETVISAYNKTGAIIVMTGKTDYIYDGRTVFTEKCGVPQMKKITGTGCMLTSLVCAALTVSSENPAEACRLAVRTFGKCGEDAFRLADKNSLGTASAAASLIDNISLFTERSSRFEKL